MTNLLRNYFNRPAEYKKGQIWSCREIDEKIVITDDDEYLTKMGIVRGMVLSKEFYLSDKKDLVYKPSGSIKNVIPNQRVLLRITDGPISVEDLSLYIGELPKAFTSKIKSPPLTIPALNPVQEEYASNLLLKMRPLRTKAIEMSEQFSVEFNRKILLKLIILNKLMEKAPRLRYSPRSADTDRSKEFDNFWSKERKNRNKSLQVMKDEDSIIRLSVVDGRLYFVSYSNKFRKLSDISLVSGKKTIRAVDDSISFAGKNGRVLTSFKDTPKLEAGEWILNICIDDKSRSFSLIIE